jgi:hypothetical protein
MEVDLTVNMRFGMHLHYRHAAACRRRTFCRYQRRACRKDGRYGWLPSHETYVLMRSIGWTP